MRAYGLYYFMCSKLTLELFVKMKSKSLYYTEFKNVGTKMGGANDVRAPGAGQTKMAANDAEIGFKKVGARI